MTIYTNQRQIILDRVTALMGWSKVRASLWFRSVNPMLGGVTPKHMVRKGRFQKLMRFIDNAEREKTEEWGP